RRRGGHHDEVELARVDGRVAQRVARRLDRQVRGHLAVAHDAALADAGALADPLVAGVDAALGDVGIGDDVVGQIRAEADDLRTDHEAAASGSGWGARWARSETIRWITPASAMSTAMSRALAKPSASVPPWLFTTMPLRP